MEFNSLVAPVQRRENKRIIPLVALFAAAALVAIAFLANNTSNSAAPLELESYSALQVGRYAVRAERQARGYRLDAERQIALATNADNEASDDNDMSEEEEKRARASAYLAADVKDRIEKTLDQGRDQVKQSTKEKAQAGRLSNKADAIMGLARQKLSDAKKHERAYKAEMGRYGKVVDSYDAVMMERTQLLDKINTAGIKLADDMTAYTKAAKAGGDGKTAAALLVTQDRAALADLETQHITMEAKVQKAKEQTDKYQPLIISANKNERTSQDEYGTYTRLKHQANRLYQKAADLMDHADTIDGLIGQTEKDLKAKRKEFMMYKTRAEKEMAISLHAEDQEDELRRAARQSRFMAGKLFDKARRLSALSQKGLNEVMKQKEEASLSMGGLQTGFEPTDKKILSNSK